MKSETTIVTAGLVILVGLWLSSQPNCNKGCKSVAEHLVQHGLEDLVAGLLA
jgi:hypothetical protein